MSSLTFYGGVNEIGGNKILLEDGDTRIFLDFGMSFDKKGDFYEEFLQARTNNGLKDLMELGMVPKIDGIYREDLLKIDGTSDIIKELGCDDYSLWISDVKSYDDVIKAEGKPFVQGVLISHGHLDHFQYISLLDENIPIYCSEITKIIIEVTEEIGKTGFENEFISVKKRALSTLTSSKAYFPGAPTIRTEAAKRTYKTLQEHQKIGDIDVRTFPVDHSVPGGMAFLLTTSHGKTIVYSGDLRFHGPRGNLTEDFENSLKGSRPDALIIEGTRIDEDTPDSESDVGRECIELVSKAKGLAMVGFAWKDIARYQTMKEVARETGRILVISPKLAYIINKLKHVEGLGLQDISSEQNVKVYLKRKGSMLYSKGDYVKTKYDAGYTVDWDIKDPATISLEHFTNGIKAYEVKQNPSKYLIHLDFYDFNELIDLSPPQDSIYIRASSEPFNMEMELDEKRLKHWLQHFNINAPEYKPFYIHASGHASGLEIKQLIHDINPKIVYPIHTKHAQMFAESAPEETKVEPLEVGREYTF
jgi:ribonuclease J